MNNDVTIEEFLGFFPKVELPIEITDQLVVAANKLNRVLPEVVIQKYILEWEKKEDIDELTEFVPILSLEGIEDFHAIIYWRGRLMKYDYFLVTLDKKGKLISRKPLASTLSDGKVVKRSVAIIDKNLVIHIMAGENLADGHYNATNSQAFNLEILPTGDIIFSLGED